MAQRGGWFSYQLKDAQHAAKHLRVRYYGADKNSVAIYINGALLKKEQLDGAKGAVFFEVDYAIPDNFLSAETGAVEVRFSASGEEKTPGVYYVRLMK